jgi:RNA polymerase sigma-70 factor (ECF subfamily)
MSPEPGPKLDKLTDEQLIAAYQGGRRDAFTVLIERYRNELFHFLARFMGDRAAAEDIFQEAFLQVHLSVDTFEPDKRFKPWLFTIAANKARDYMRKRARRPAAPLDAPMGGDAEAGSFIDLLEAEFSDPEENLESTELVEEVQRIISQMPEHLREILLLSYFQKLSYNEIAESLQIPLGTVKSRLHTAVANFAKAWKTPGTPGRARSGNSGNAGA